MRPTAGVPPQAEAKSSSSATKDDDLEELWVVSFSVDDDRELNTAQVRELIAKGQLNGETIVWQEGMSDWLPISQVPELAQSLKTKHVTASAHSSVATTATPDPRVADDGDDETVIYRPGSKAAAFMESPTASVAAEKLRAMTGSVSAAASTATTRTPDLKQDAAPRATVNAVVARPLAHSPQASGQRPSEASAATRELSEKPAIEAPSPRGTPVATKTVGGPPPLRRQPSRPDESVQPRQPAAVPAQPPGNDEFVTSVREYTPAPARAIAPPPLPANEKRQTPNAAPTAKPELFPAAAQSAQPVHAAPPFAAVATPRSLPPTPSFAPRPSDIAALTRIRPKFPKWLPFAVLAGLVVLVAIMAALSWIRGDNEESQGQKPTADSSGPMDPTRPKASTGVAQTNALKDGKATGGPVSDGFASKFAQAAAKQRPTGKFDREAAEKALAPAFAKAAGCHNKGEPTGTANVTVSLSPAGQVLSVTVAQPFATSFTAECIRNALRDASVPPFQGSPGRLAHSIPIH